MQRLLLSSLIVTALGFAVALPALANSDLIISEYVEGSSNNKAIELWNHTGAAIDLGAGGYKIQMYFNGNPAVGGTVSLVGTVANNDVFVLVYSGAAPALLALADQTSATSFYNGDDAVVLVKGVGNTVVDAIGQTAFDPGTEWGTGLVSTADNTLRRKGSVCDGDTDASNVFDPSVEWDGYAQDTFSGIGSHSDGCGPTPAVPGTWGGLKAIYR